MLSDSAVVKKYLKATISDTERQESRKKEEERYKSGAADLPKGKGRLKHHNMHTQHPVYCTGAEVAENDHDLGEKKSIREIGNNMSN